MSATAVKILPNYINGAWVPSASSELLDVQNPATGEVLAQVPLSGASDVDQAVLDAVVAHDPARAEKAIQKLIDGARDDIDHVLTHRKKLPKLGKPAPQLKAA